MITLAFIILMFVVFVRLTVCAIKLTWGITRVAFSLVFLPISLIIGFVAGLFELVFPVLLIVGIISLFIKY